MIQAVKGASGLGMRRSAPPRFHLSAITILLCLIAGASLAPDTAMARTRQGDRFGIRGGIWPQSDIIGTFGTRRIYPSGDSLSIRIDEASRVLPYVEIFGLFHVRGLLWGEGSLGWSGRNDVQVGGFGRGDAILLGDGRVDFFPLFVGARLARPFGGQDLPHNVYARGGASLVFANESPELVQDSVLKYDIYNPGTEGAFGFLLGTGGEYYLNSTIALTADVSYRYTKFSYNRRAKFDLSAIWLGAGITLKTR